VNRTRTIRKRVGFFRRHDVLLVQKLIRRGYWTHKGHGYYGHSGTQHPYYMRPVWRTVKVVRLG
jgi:hypothetical protein